MTCRSCQGEVVDEARFCRYCGTETHQIASIHRDRGARWKYMVVGVIAFYAMGILVVAALVGSLFVFDSAAPIAGDFSNLLTALDVEDDGDAAPEEKRDRNDAYRMAASSVVDILCDDGANGSGGSGVIMNADGTVLTNAHIVLRDVDGAIAPADCVVTLPDPITGRIREIYRAEPVLVPEASDRYDLAFFRIAEPYADDHGITYGSSTATFPPFWTHGCRSRDVQLGDAVRVFGYPAISADGYYLTVTDGVVSALPNDDTIISSAKVSLGSSGGMAADKNGCMIGIVTEINWDEGDTLGVIYSNTIVDAFLSDPLTQQTL